MRFSVKNDKTFSNLKGRFVLTPTNPIYSGLITGDNFMIKKDIRADSIKTSSLDLIGLCDEPATRSSGFRVYNDEIVHDIVMPQTVSDDLIQLTGTGGFGLSVAISGDTCIIGAPFTNSFAGAVYIYTRGNGDWMLDSNQPLLNVAGGQFGSSVAISGDTCIVGAPYVDSSGAAYIYTRVNGEWVLYNNGDPFADPFANDQFGYSVDISGDTCIIGARGVDSSAGAAYIYTKVNGVWMEDNYNQPLVGAATSEFGGSVAISGKTCIVGAENFNSYVGAAYIYTKVNGVWIEDIYNQPLVGNVDYGFGESVAISGDTCIVGAPYADENGSDSGAAYIYTRVNDVWALDNNQPLVGNVDYVFGWDVSISGDTCIIGARGVDSYVGATYIYTKVNDDWVQNGPRILGHLPNEQFGYSCAISCNTCIIGNFNLNKAYIKEGVVYKGDIQI